MKNKFSALLIFFLAVLSCSKDESDPEPTKTDILTQQTWKFDNAGVDIDKNGTIDNNLPPTVLPPCLTDNTISFVNDGSGTVDEGAEKCMPTDPQTTSFNWNFTENETAINISGNAVAGTNGGKFKILQLTETQLSLSKDTTFQGFSVAVIANFKH